MSVPILWGLPGGDVAEAAAQGRVAIGGCVIGPEIPAWECTGDRRHRWGADADDAAAGDAIEAALRRST